MDLRSAIALAGAATISVAAAAAPNKEVTSAPAIDTITIIGSQENVRNIAGSSALISPEQIQLEAATDINQLLKTVPGIYIREEEGLGLRPNIGIRGATSERSTKITLMEDGVLIAPAPYSDPAAYYFPTAQRQSAVEIIKGAPLLRYGPQTTGGVVNLVSTPIPRDDLGGKIRFMLDDRGLMDLHGVVGGQAGQWGWMLETVQRDGESFKEVDRNSDRGEIDIGDYLAKLAWNSGGDLPQHSLLLKLQYSEELSEETYLGLTDRDFDRDSERRYGLSAPDEMNNRHNSVSLSYNLRFNDMVTTTATIYRNEFKRDWFKLSGGATLIENANNGDATAQAQLDGTEELNNLGYKHNNRRYESEGIDINTNVALAGHSIDVGVRVHEDEVDRFQPVERFNQTDDGNLVFVTKDLPGAGGSDNRVGSAEAFSFWAVDSWQITNALNITGALRYESVETNEVRFNDVDRTTIARETPSDNSEWLPGLSFTYEINESWQVLGGVHRGFAPLTAGSEDREEPETSVNWEGGARFNSDGWFIEAIAFHSDFSDKTENCSLANNCSNGADSGSFTLGEAVIRGIELQFSTAFNRSNMSIPLDIAATWTDAEMVKNKPSEDIQSGDLLKDVPEYVFSVRTGVELNNGLNTYVVAKYIDELCVDVGCNRRPEPRQTTESLFVIDLVSHYDATENLGLFLKAENILDEQRIVSRNPDGARPNKPRTLSVGVEYSF